MPPEVDPLQPQMTEQMMRMPIDNGGHRVVSCVAKPVVVAMDATWKAASRKAVLTERYFAYVSEKDPAYANETIQARSLIGRPVWIMKDGVQLLDTTSLPAEEAANYEHYFEGGRVGTLIQIVNDSGGLTMVPETHIDLILYSFQKHLRPIVDPELKRTICLAVRKDYIHESLLNVVAQAIKSIIPGTLLAPAIRPDRLRL